MIKRLSLTVLSYILNTRNKFPHLNLIYYQGSPICVLGQKIEENGKRKFINLKLSLYNLWIIYIFIYKYIHLYF